MDEISPIPTDAGVIFCIFLAVSCAASFVAHGDAYLVFSAGEGSRCCARTRGLGNSLCRLSDSGPRIVSGRFTILEVLVECDPPIIRPRLIQLTCVVC